jgi:hypothetical protein
MNRFPGGELCPAVVVVVVDVEVVEEVEVVLVVVEDDADAFNSTATSSQVSPLLAVQLQVAVLGMGTTVELDAPVIALDAPRSHCFVHIGLPRVTPPYIDGESSTQLSGYCVEIEIVGLPAAVA